MIYGLDIGGTKIELAIFDRQLQLQDCQRRPTPTRDYPQFLDAVAGAVQEADQKTGARGSVGIGLCGFLDGQGRAVAANIACINGRPVAEDLAARLGRPVHIENDVNAFASSEVTGGAAAGVKYALGLVIGTGLAGGLCLDGRLYLGRQKAALECGHIALPALLQQRYKLPLRRCGCGGHGCAELWLSGPGLLRLGGLLGADYGDTEGLMAAVREGEARALAAFAAWMQCLGGFLAQLVLLYDPDIIVLGGGLSGLPEIYQQVDAAMQPWLLGSLTAPAIVPPRFGDSSGVRGAALLGQRQTGPAGDMYL